MTDQVINLEVYAEEHWESVVHCEQCLYWQKNGFCPIVNGWRVEKEYCDRGKQK